MTESKRNESEMAAESVMRAMVLFCSSIGIEYPLGPKQKQPIAGNEGRPYHPPGLSQETGSGCQSTSHERPDFLS